MILFTKTRLSPKLVHQYPRVLWVFGDNVLRSGKAGQAIIRDCCNAYGVCTKWVPRMTEEAFFSDGAGMPHQLSQDLKRIEPHLQRGTKVVIPGSYSDIQLGTGLAQLPQRAPKIYAEMSNILRGYAQKYGHINIW
jgi:hypothetical protein